MSAAGPSSASQPKVIFSAIAAMSSNRVIGKDGDLPWKIPEDFKFFKDKTSGHIMIMGRKTFDSLPGALPNRYHIVITRQRDYHPAGAHVVSSVEDAIRMASELALREREKWGTEVFIIGGGEIYREMLSTTDRIYLTEVHREFEGDAKFPEFSSSDFHEVERRARPDGPVPFDFVTYERDGVSDR